MRTLKYAILGLLQRRPMTGYDITKEFNKELANFWNAKHSQIYPELKRLSMEKLIEYEVEISGEVLEKKVYSITKKGSEDFLVWVNKNEPMEPAFKDVFRLRMYYSENIDRRTLIILIKSQIEERQEKYDKLREKLMTYTEAPGFENTQFGEYIILRGAVIREAAYLQWLKECLGNVATD